MESRSFHQSIIWCGHRRCCRCVCHSILRQNKQQGISLQKYTLFRKKGIIWMMKYSPVKCFKICHIFGIRKSNSLTNEMKTNKNSLCINLLFLKCEESGYFFRGCFAEKRDFCYAAEFATQFIKLICCEKKITWWNQGLGGLCVIVYILQALSTLPCTRICHIAGVIREKSFLLIFL